MKEEILLEFVLSIPMLNLNSSTNLKKKSSTFRLEMAEKESRGVTLHVPGVQFDMPDGPDGSSDDDNEDSLIERQRSR